MCSSVVLQRQLFKEITKSVLDNEGVQAMQDFVAQSVASKYHHLPTRDLAVAVFLREHQDVVKTIPVTMLDVRQRGLLYPPSPEAFDLNQVDPSTLVVIVRFLLPRTPNGKPEPSHSIWKTRLKLLGLNSKLENFVCLWRLWLKYQQSTQPNLSIADLLVDFSKAERAINTLSTSREVSGRRLCRFRGIIALGEKEDEATVIKITLDKFKELEYHVRMDDSGLERAIRNQNSLKEFLKLTGLL